MPWGAAGTRHQLRAPHGRFYISHDLIHDPWIISHVSRGSQSFQTNQTHEENRAAEVDAVIVRRLLETVIKLDEAIEAPQA